MRERLRIVLARSARRVVEAGLLICMLLVTTKGAQEQIPTLCDKSNIPERIAKIMVDTLRQGEKTVNGVLAASTRVPPSNEAVEEVRCYGDDAVPVLTTYLHSKDQRKRELAIRFLGELGGSRIVEALRTVAQSDTSPLLRNLAVRWLTAAPWDLASPIIKQVSETDWDPNVREAARDVLSNHGPKRP